MVVAWRFVRHTAVLHGELEHATGLELPHGGTVDFLPWGRAFRDRRRGLAFAACDLVVADECITATASEIDADRIASSEPSEAAACRAFRRTVEDRRAVGGARLAAVTQRRQAHDAACEQRIGRLHVDDFGR